MKRSITVLSTILILFSCGKDNTDTSTTTIVQNNSSEPEVKRYTLTVESGEGGSVSSHELNEKDMPMI
jgi:hypothetical protein